VFKNGIGYDSKAIYESLRGQVGLHLDGQAIQRRTIFSPRAALLRQAGHRQSENLARSSARDSGPSFTSSHQHAAAEAEQANDRPQASQVFRAGSDCSRFVVISPHRWLWLASRLSEI
jgi:hypothetical protein